MEKKYINMLYLNIMVITGFKTEFELSGELAGIGIIFHRKSFYLVRCTDSVEVFKYLTLLTTLMR